MSYVEILALISTILCVVLSAREHILAWPIGIISAIVLIIIYVPNNMYANIGLQTVFIVQCSIGWYNWGEKEGLSVSKLPFNKAFLQFIGCLVLGVVYAKVNTLVNPQITWFNAYLDGITTFIALLGNWYLTKKIIQAWPFFMIYNVIIAFLLASQGIYIIAGLNICLFFISLNGFRTWKRNLDVV